jgi:hypothetical protein
MIPFDHDRLVAFGNNGVFPNRFHRFSFSCSFLNRRIADRDQTAAIRNP